MKLPNYQIEKKLMQSGCNIIAGIDEAGRGPLAGPVVAAAVIFKRQPKIKGINDSKKISNKKRQELYKQILFWADSVGIAIVDVNKINKLNILKASLLAMKNAVMKLSVKPDHLIIDGREKIPYLFNQTCIIKGDGKSVSIAAASIVAKVVRDGIMLKYHEKYPHYKFHQHKGYGTAEHFRLLKKYGPSPIHRLSWESVRQIASAE